MGFFDKLKEPIFFKESSDAKVQLEQLKELCITAPDSIKKQIEQDIKMLSYGISGEDNVRFELMNSFMPIIILHDLYFEHEGLSAQIDYLVITRKVVILIECKNLFGNIEVTSNGEFIRTIEYGGKKVREGIYSPITQNQRHLELFVRMRREQRTNFITKKLFDMGSNDMFKSVVVLANPKTIINMKYAKRDVKEQIIRSDQLIDYIKRLNKASKNPDSSDKEMRELAEMYLNHHTPNPTDYTKKYGIDEPQVKTPVLKHTPDAVEEKIAVNKLSAEKIEDTAIYQALKLFRHTRSKEESVKAYFIFNNSQMEDLINLMPKSLDEMKTIHGFGEVKCEKYGQEILMIIDKYRVS